MEQANTREDKNQSTIGLEAGGEWARWQSKGILDYFPWI